MSDAIHVISDMCRSYSNAVNASDSATYAKLFTEDAIRMPPGAIPEYGRQEIQKGEQADYDTAKWNVTFAPRDALPITEDWIYGIADVEVNMVAHADGERSDFRLTVARLLEKQSSGEWLIKRQMWNRKPERSESP